MQQGKGWLGDNGVQMENTGPVNTLPLTSAAGTHAEVWAIKQFGLWKETQEHEVEFSPVTQLLFVTQAATGFFYHLLMIKHWLQV